MAEEKRSVVDVLSQISGISQEDGWKLVEEVKANQAKLKACSRHDFQVAGRRAFLDDYLCANCGGKVDSMAYHWYSDGLRHGLEGGVA